jgi:hypothetical protein
LSAKSKETGFIALLQWKVTSHVMIPGIGVANSKVKAQEPATATQV